MLWLLSREESGDKIVIELNSRRFPASDPPEFRARIQSLADLTTATELVAELIEESGAVVPLKVTTESSGTSIRGRLPKVAPGFHRLRVRPREDIASLPAAEKAFQTISESRELAQPMADPVYLRQLANLTAEHGGAAFSPDEIDGLIETIRLRRRQSETPIIEKYRLGDGPVSGWILFGLFAGALSIEWFLRRKWGLA